MTFDRKPNEHTTRLMTFKFIAMLLAAIAALIYMAIQIWVLQEEHGGEFERRAIAQLINRNVGTEVSVTPNRGAILDRNHHTMAYSSIVYDVFMDVRRLAGMQSRAEQSSTDALMNEFLRIIHTTAEILDIDEQILWDLLERYNTGNLTHGAEHQIFARGRNLATERALTAARLPHIHTTQNTIRTYLYGGVAPQIIGFERGDAIWGLERQFNTELSGIDGRIFRTFDASGLGIITERVEPTHGHNLVLTIDLMLQQLAENVVTKYGIQHNAEHTLAIVMRPHTGEVVAMAAYPSFDATDPMNPALLTSPWLAEEWAELDNNLLAYNFNSVWRNFNITHTFQPGSTFKSITVAAALEEGVISIYDTFYCNRLRVIAGHEMRCHSRHGRINLREVIAFSCNVALMDIAEKMGRDIFYRYQRDFGFGRRTGIDLPAEVSAEGLLHSHAGLNASELAASSFGQTFHVTPIQAITSFSALINGGFLYTPHVVSQVVDANNRVVYDRQPQAKRQVISREVSDWMRCAMVDTFVYGTGARARPPGHDVGGKSGTADQHGREGDEGHYVATSFIGYFPADNPEYVVMTIIYNPRDGRTPSAAFMFTELVLDIIHHRRIPPTSGDVLLAGPGSVSLPDFDEMPVWRAAQVLNNDFRLDFQFVGNGDTVVGQFPRAGDHVSQNGIVFLMVDNHGRDSLAAVPDVTDMPLRLARQAITDAGFVPHVVFGNTGETSDELNFVHGQTPDPWQSVSEGMMVTLRVRVE